LPLIRWLSLHGVSGCRRSAAALIASGRVSVNGERCLSPARSVGPRDAVSLDSVLVQQLAAAHLHVVLNKERGSLTTRAPRAGREVGLPTVYDFLPDAVRARHCCAVGRLDADTTGVLLFTSDGALAARLLDPGRLVVKRYRATLRPQAGGVTLPLADGAAQQLARGVTLPASRGKLPRLVSGRASNVEGLPGEVTLEIHGGAHHQAKIMLSLVGRPVLSLHRERFAGIGVEELALGCARELRPDEASLLYRLTSDSPG
jgi:pseudouridine synthase